MATLTELQAYAAMILFLERYMGNTTAGQVADMLSAMYIVEGDKTFETFDAGYWSEWLADVEVVLKAAETEDTWNQFVDDRLVYKLTGPDGAEVRFRLGGDPNYHTDPLSLDDPVHRQLLEETVSDEANLHGNLNDGVSLYYRTLSDGTQIWAHVKDGVIVEGGRNQIPL